MRCLRRLAYVRWQEKTEVLQICKITGIEAFLITAQLRWTGHVLRMAAARTSVVLEFAAERRSGKYFGAGTALRRIGLLFITAGSNALQRSGKSARTVTLRELLGYLIHEICSIGSQEIIEFVATSRQLFKAKMHQIRFPLGFRPRPNWGA